MSEAGRRATIEAVARQAGVSRSTVSRVLTGSTLVSDKARESVQQAIETLDYVPNRAAQSLASRRTRSIILLIPEEIGKFFSDPFFAPAIEGIDAQLRESEFIFTMFIASGSDDKTIDYVRSGAAEGILILSHHVSDHFVAQLNRALPVVLGGRPSALEDNEYYVDVDNELGGRRATEYLVERGYQNIAMITPAMDQPYAIDRLAGYQGALAAANFASAGIADGQSTYAGGVEAMQKLLGEASPDAVFVGSDLMARGAADYLLTSGYAIPGDVALIGFDDSSAATSTRPHLSTVRQPLEQLGRVMAQNLIDIIEGKQVSRQTILPVEVVHRETA